MGATIVDKTACEAAAQGQEGGLLPVNPFTALQFHFGMLLGVDDLETGQAYARGKMRLHNAWLHREGVVWGLNVAFNDHNELTVAPGLALDAAGRELHLDRLACLDLGQWYAANKADTRFTFDADGDGKRFSLHVVARFKACLTRPVPAIAEPCACGCAQTDTAYSRVFETVELLLRPGLSTSKDRGYHRLRILFLLEKDNQDKYDDVRKRREAIQALPAVEQPAAYLQALREFAALDEINLKPQAATASEPASIFPEDPTEVLLADIADIVVKPNASGGWTLAAPIPTPVVTVRPSHIATATIQELLCGPLFRGSASPTGPTVTDAELVKDTIQLRISRPVAVGSVKTAAFSVSSYNDKNKNGWSKIKIKALTQDGDSLWIVLTNAPTGDPVRLIVHGTGPTPLLAADNHLPLGAPGAGGADDGVDFVKMFKRS
jgi:hypothetical protein